MECRLQQILPMGDVNDHLVIGRLAAEYALIENVFASPIADEILSAARHAHASHDERDPHRSPLKEAAWSPAGDATPL